MAFAKGVIHLHHDGAQGAPLVVCGAVAIPEAHRLEGIAQHARVGMQPCLAGRVMNAFALQDFVQPGDGPALFRRAAIAVVGVEEAQCARVVDVPLACLSRLLLQGAQWQHQKVGGVCERVALRAQPGVAHLAETDEGYGLAHASANKLAAAASPALRPSS